MKAFKFSKPRLIENDNKHKIPYGNIVYIIAFVIPLIIFIALYYSRNIFPFGNSCYLRSDMYHQYAPFFSEFWNKLRTGGSLTYSWNIGMGTNFTALYAYYLASPINWLIFLFPQKYMIEIMNALIILKLCLASVSITYYISKHFKTKSCVIAVFGMFYAMSGYIAAYSWNIMWLDCIILLPLIFLGLERLVKDNKYFLYCITLGLCIFTNYYISIMVCISVVIYFIVLMFSYNGSKDYRQYLKKCFNFVVFSLIAGGLAACLLLPETYAFSLSASSESTFPQTFTTYFPMMKMLVRQLINVHVHLGLEHYPNIYCGVAVFFLIPLYIMNSKISTREKIGKTVILLIFLISFNMNILNYIWHGFHFPNSLPCRQAFIYIFFIITMSFEALHHIKDYSKKQLAGALWIALGFLFIAEQLYTGTSDGFDFKIIYISGAFILVYMFIIYFSRSRFCNPSLLVFLLFASTIIECTTNMAVTGLSTTSRTAYVRDNEAVKNVINYASENDDSFYRIEKISGIRSKNDSAWHNYKSTSVFSSTSNAGVSDLFNTLGCQSSTNAYAYKGATLFTASLFNVKYFLGNEHINESNLVKYYYGNNGEFLYENKYTLPLGFTVNSDINNLWDTTSRNSIEAQNEFIELNTGISDTFIKMYEYRTEPDVTFSPLRNGHMYVLVQTNSIDDVTVSINSEITNFSDLKNDKYILDLGYVTVNDIIQMYSTTSLNSIVYSIDESKYIQAINTLNRGGYNITKHSDTHFEGTVNAENDKAMLFSIPYDKGWRVTVDGKVVKTFPIKDALLGINIPEGEHTVVLNYTPVGLVWGILITLTCILILAALFVLNRLKANNNFDIKEYVIGKISKHKT